LIVTAATTRRPGRPRSAGVDEALLDPTLQLAGEVGINGMSMDDLAQRAGVSKATIYRRWPSKEALVLDSLARAIRPFDLVDTGSVRGDLDSYLRELGHRMRTGRTSDVLPDLISASARDAALRESLDEWVLHRREPLNTILGRAVQRGELAAETDLDIIIDALLGAFVYRRLLSHAPLDDAFVTRLLDTVMPSIRAVAVP
jgi:AcrR family transcriptional regulator